MDIVLLALRILLAALLYAFLGAVLFTLWRDLRATTAEPRVARPEGWLVVLGPEEGEGVEGEGEEEEITMRRFPLQPVTSIGRSPANTLVIDDTFASAHHALLTWREGRWWVEDRGSRNGTLLNGQPVEEPMLVAAGDVIRVGETRLRLEMGGGAGEQEGKGTEGRRGGAVGEIGEASTF